MSGAGWPLSRPTCKVCGRQVAYQERWKCRACREWVHGECAADVPGRTGSCIACQCEDPKLDFFLQVADETGWSEEDPEGRGCFLLVLASCFLGTDEEVLSRFLGFTPEFVAPRAKRLRDSGIWADGKVCLDVPEDDESALAYEVCLTLCAMCAQGLLVRTSGGDEPPGPPGAAGGAAGGA